MLPLAFQTLFAFHHAYDTHSRFITALYVDDVANYATSFHSQTVVAKTQDYLNRLALPYIKEHKIKVNDDMADSRIFTKKGKIALGLPSPSMLTTPLLK